ncbi:hypothetical protein [Larkinella soli]|uniref:hypothetical protein n=1 Tax=Larkinella soli TaxID=1770527 RepID=UPI000FFCBDB1|nr:hypothetical protein [Larkinella soli]
MEENLSPACTYRIVFDVFEVRMSHWIEEPSIYRVADGALLFDLKGDVWSADRIVWHSDSVVEMQVRKYPGRVSCTLTLDLAAQTGRAACGTDTYTGFLPDLKAWVLRY